MQRSTCVLISSLLASALSAQCFEPNLGALAPRGANPPGVGDDVLFDLQPLNFVFALGGVAASYTHAHVQSNGVVFLTNGALSGATTTGFSTNAAAQIAALRGNAGQPPRIAPFWRDIVLDSANGGAVWINNTLPGKFVVTWQNAIQFNTTGPLFTFQAQLLADGTISYHYGPTTTSVAPVIVGVSAGDGIAAVPGIDLSVTNNTGSTQLMFERFATGAFDLETRCLQFRPNAGGGFDATSALPAAHESYGAGCYDIAAESFYQGFASAVTAASALTGQSMVLTPTANGYAAAWGGGSYITPTAAATALALIDDGEVTVTPSQPLPSPFGPAAGLRVHANGIVSLGTSPQTFPGTTAFQPTVAALLEAGSPAFWSWHDYNPAEPGSGQVKFEEVTVGTDTIACVTWDAVESFSQPLLANPSTLQFQLNLANGQVKVVWVDIDDNPTSQFGSSHLIGISPGGPSADPGAIALATALPLMTSPDRRALQLSASPAPRSTATQGTTVTYTTDNIPEAAPGSGIYLGANILSLGGVPTPGVDLGFLGAPGCRAHILTLNLTQALVGSTSSLSATFDVPAGVPVGFELYAQSCALVVPLSLPNGQNAAGLLTSNGIRSYISPL